MSGLVSLQPIDFAVTQGPRATFGETARAAFGREQEVGEITSQTAFESEIYQPVQDFLRANHSQVGGLNSYRSMLGRGAYENRPDFYGDAPTLADFIAELDVNGIEYPDEITPDGIAARRERLTAEKLARVEGFDEVLGRSRGASGIFGQLAGGFGAGFDNAEAVVAMPFGAASRAGILMTGLVEGGLSAATEAATTPVRNEFLRELGLPEESVLENAAFGFAVGGTMGVTLRGLSRTGELLMSSRDARRAAATIGEQNPSPAVQSAARAVLRDLEDEEAALATSEPDGLREYQGRAEEAQLAAIEGRAPEMPERPLAAIPSIAEDGSTLVDPRELLVQPEVFQFKSEIVAEGGVTPKLQSVTEWVPHRAGVAIVYEYPDGSRAIADGHQRTALARRIMEQDPSQDIRLRAEVFRAEDGYTVEDIRVLAALKNIAEAADGMTARMAGDAAKVLRLRPEALADLPRGPGIARAQNLAKLSDDAFDLYINRVIDERFAEQIGRMVDDLSMHLPIARLIERVRPETTEQASNIISQALEAPTSRETTSDLFGETEVVESLYLEQAKVLERAMRIMRDDRSVFKTLTDQADRIEGAGRNRLDKTTNAQARQQVETALAAIKQLAHRAGPISEALRDGAQSYKENGRLKDAAERVATAVRGEVERNGLSGLATGSSRRAAQSARAQQAAPDPNAGFSDPVGEAAQAQVRQTRLVANERPAEAFSGDEVGRQGLKRLVEAGADRAQIDNHPVVVSAIEDMAKRPETRLSDGYGTEAWHAARSYDFNGEKVDGTEAALERWVDGAERLASAESGVEFAGVQRNKELTIILGPPAAGKSTIANDIALARGAAILDSDEIKKTIPEFDGGIGASAVHEESSDLTSIVENVLMGEGTNIVFPKVGGNARSIRKTVDRYKAAGYEVRLVNMNVTPENAYRRMIGRFVNTGRLIPPSYVDEVGAKPSAVFRELKAEGRGDGFAEIDNNGGLNDPKTVNETEGVNALEGSQYDPAARGPDGQGADAGGQGDGGPRFEETSAGQQSLIDGVAPVTTRDRLEAAQAAPMTGGQAPADVGLFDLGARSQGDMFDQVPVGRGFDDDGNEIALTRSRQELVEELDADDEFVEQLGVCLK